MARTLTSKKTAKGEGKKRLVILDTHAIIHRAYHALPEFSSSRGEPTGALYGLTSILIKIAETLKPDYVVAARDLPAPTHRHDVFEGYKATRVKAEDALVAQLESAGRVFEAFGIPVYEAAGFEADDVLGTIVREVTMSPEGAGLEIVIASGDHDTLQLVDDERVRVFTMRTGINDTVIYDEESVKERYGFAPELLIDYKGMRGDPSDNIKGIPGIGEKTATQLIQCFGSIEDIYKKLKTHPEEFGKNGIKPRVVKLLLEGEDAAIFSKMLATIRTDAPITFSMPEHEWDLSNHAETIYQLCDDLEFRTLKERLRSVLHARAVDSQVALPLQEAKPEEAEAPPEDSFRETSVALWLLRSDMTDPTLEDIAHYTREKNFDAAREAIFTELNATGRLRELYDTIERPLIPIVGEMRTAGISLDVPYLNELSEEYTKELGRIAERIYGYAGREFNVSSPKQLGAVLFDELKLSLPRHKKTAGGARTTREDELSKLRGQHPIIEDILAYRELQKLLSTYIESLPSLVGDDGRLHARFLQAGTTTGRMSSESPNLQNIPIRTDYGKRIRRAFTAPKGKVLLALDYSQIELRIAAGLSADEKLIDIFKRGGDVHAAVAAEVFNVPHEMVDAEMRRRAKIINFGIIYGMGVNALRANLGEDVSRDEAANFLHRYFEDFSGVARYIELTKMDAARLGYTETLFGRRRYFSGFRSPLPAVRAQAERMAINAPIQGTQADIIKLAMVRADAMLERRGWKKDTDLVLQVHDELVYEVPQKAAPARAEAIAEVMEHVVEGESLGGVPIIVQASLGDNWGETERIDIKHRA